MSFLGTFTRDTIELPVKETPKKYISVSRLLFFILTINNLKCLKTHLRKLEY